MAGVVDLREEFVEGRSAWTPAVDPKGSSGVGPDTCEEPVARCQPATVARALPL
jgi:hypothetical protein